MSGCLCLILFLLLCTAADQIFNGEDYANDYPFYPPDTEPESGYAPFVGPEVLRKQSGVNIVLKCNSTHCSNKQKITWEFKACQPDFKNIPCRKYYDLMESTHSPENFTWAKLNNVAKRRCSSQMELKNANATNSGIYRCIESNKPIKTYEIEVIDSVKYGGNPPELLDVSPANSTISQNTQIIIQCKVYSQHPPVIWWFKQSDVLNYDIHYLDQFYSRINTSIQVYPVPHELNVYLSKLNIQNARDMDTGVYVCVAMTEYGKDLKNASIKVISTGNYWEPHASFSLLFLIPLAFALIPVTVWLCYYRKKKKNERKSNAPLRQEQTLTRPILRERNRVPVV